MKNASSPSSPPFSDRRARAAIAAAGLLTLGALLGAAGLSAFDREPSGPVEDRELARRLVRETLDGYRGYTRGAFTESVAEDFVPDRSRFVDGVERSFAEARPSEVDFAVDQVTKDAGVLAVTISWNKKTLVRASGAEARSSGRCLLVYKSSEEGWRLHAVKGESPF